MKRVSILAAASLAAISLVLAGCAPTSPSSPSSEPAGLDIRAEHGLSEMTTMEIIDYLDEMPVSERPADLIASVQPDELLLVSGDHEEPLPIPESVSYISIAPYLEQTHDCYFHSLTTCRGELANQDVQVRIIDDATGDVLVDEAATTFDNGFVGYWLPSDVAGTIEITQDGNTGTAPFSTGSDGASCITTLRLSS